MKSKVISPLVISSILLMSLVATLYAVAPGSVGAIEGIVPDKPLGVDLTETLISLDLDGDKDLTDEGDAGKVSGYTFTVQSVKASFGKPSPPTLP